MLTARPPLLLASASPRRRELLERVGVPLVAIGAEADESTRSGDTPESFLARIVSNKAISARSITTSVVPVARLVADTIVVVDDRILNKPGDPAEARAMIQSIAGRSHSVMTRFRVERADDFRAIERTVATEVEVRDLSPAWIDGYVDTAEGVDKAGGYAIQGRFAFAIRAVRGSYTNVVGLPLCEVVEALEALGLLLPPFFT
jgi:septum formation protein